MMDAKEKAYALLREWKGGSYIFGRGVAGELGGLVARYGKRVLLFSSPTYDRQARAAIASMEAAGCEVLGGTYVTGARPNAPYEDVYRMETHILHRHPDVVVQLGAGSSIDACKAAITLASLGDAVTPELPHYFGAGAITGELERTGRKLIPYVAVETCASSGAHLTKYSNTTDMANHQKKLIVDEAVVPLASLFDYDDTVSMPRHVTMDGALDGMAHTFEVFCGAKPAYYERAREIVETAWELILTHAKRALDTPGDREAREALGLATDLGGYAIMLGGTSGAHLTSFSLVDIVAHGTACGIMNPYYAVFYADAIQDQLLVIGNLLRRHGYIAADPAAVSGRERAVLVAEGMLAFDRAIGAPTTLGEVAGFSEAHVTRILTNAKDPTMATKLQNMPVPVTAADVDTYLEPVIRAAIHGDMGLIRQKA